MKIEFVQIIEEITEIGHGYYDWGTHGEDYRLSEFIAPEPAYTLLSIADRLVIAPLLVLDLDWHSEIVIQEDDFADIPF